MSQSRTLWAIESPALPTGYGRVAREIVPRAASSVPASQGLVAWSHRPGGGDFNSSQVQLLLPRKTEVPGVHANWNADDLEAAVQEFQPETLVTVGNLRMLECVPEVRSRPFLRWVGYFPVEGAPLPSWRLDTVAAMDAPVCFSEFGRATLEADMPQGSGSEVIPLGVNTRRFRPLPNRDRLRSEAGLAGAFVVGCVARNQPRKQLPVLMEAFRQLADRHPESVLYLHANPYDVGWDLIALAEYHGIAQRTLFTQGLAEGRSVEDAELNAIYNLFDVFVLPTSAEGFGLPILEGMAAGVPVVVTAYGAAAELAGPGAVLVPPAAYITDEASHTDLAVLDSEQLAEALLEVRQELEKVRQRSRDGRARARRHSWRNCAARWAEFLGSRWTERCSTGQTTRPPEAAIAEV